jgi:site-specific DNA recombinase
MRIAAYARYSTDAQRESSLEDQLRNCRAYSARQQWPEPTIYSDAAISGARNDRPGYRSLLADAKNFDVILVDDLSRLSRDMGEVNATVKRLGFAGVRLVGVSDGVDTARKSHKADVGLRGIMSELYLDDLAEKTHRGLTGRALAGASAGGLPYGYRIAGVGERLIDADQADVVRRIYALYVEGHSARSIASTLNAERVRSPRGSAWCASAIFGDVRRGIGILANPIYAGQQIWNRSHWIKHPDTGRRVRQERPRSEWIIRDNPDLAIVDAETWRRAQLRITGQHRDTATGKRGAGRPMKHLLSGLLRCADCGAALVIIDRYRYGCSARKERGTTVCSSQVRVARRALEAAALAGVRCLLESDSSWQAAQRAVTDELKRCTPDQDAMKAKLASAERVHANLMRAIREGIITPSTKSELLAAEAAVDEARRTYDALAKMKAATIIPRLREIWQRAIATLGDRPDEIPAARECLRDVIGDNAVVRNENGETWIEVSPSASADKSQLALVAGAGFEPATFGL